MKTVFITILEGIEAKNLLRTDAVRTILNHPDIRIVFLVKDAKHADYYQKEISSQRTTFEVIMPKAIEGLDNIFRSLKFQLFRTPTARLRRQMVFEVKKNYMTYYAGLALNWLFGREYVVKSVRWFDWLLVKNNMHSKLFDKYNPDLVLCANLFDEPEINILREAKKRSIKTIGLINSWDKPSARCLLHLIPDKVIAFNEFVKNDLVRYQYIDKFSIFLSGVPQYDQYYKNKFSSREEFFSFINTDPVNKLLVYAPMGTTYSSSDWDIIDLLHGFLMEGKFGKNIEMLVRFPPNDRIDAGELARRPWLKYDQPGHLFSAKRGIDWDLSNGDLFHLRNTLKHMSVIVCYASSISVDAAILDRPVININFELRPSEIMAKSPTQFYKMAHYRKALDSGGIRLVESEEKLIEWINRYIINPELDKEGRARLVREQCQFTDGKSGERIGKIILENL